MSSKARTRENWFDAIHTSVYVETKTLWLPSGVVVVNLFRIALSTLPKWVDDALAKVIETEFLFAREKTENKRKIVHLTLMALEDKHAITFKTSTRPNLQIAFDFAKEV